MISLQHSCPLCVTVGNFWIQSVVSNFTNKLNSISHVGFFSFVSCQILCKKLISISPSEIFLFVSCQILRTKSQASAIFWNFWIQRVVSNFMKKIIEVHFLWVKYDTKRTKKLLTLEIEINFLCENWRETNKKTSFDTRRTKKLPTFEIEINFLRKILHATNKKNPLKWQEQKPADAWDWD